MCRGSTTGHSRRPMQPLAVASGSEFAPTTTRLWPRHSLPVSPQKYDFSKSGLLPMEDIFIPTYAICQAGVITGCVIRTAAFIPMRIGPSGLSIVASDAIKPDATIVTCPFSLIITPLLSKGALFPLLQDPSILERWSERQLIIVYICFHWIASPDM